MGYEKHFIYILKKYGFNCTHFHELYKYLTGSQGDFHIKFY